MQAMFSRLRAKYDADCHFTQRARFRFHQQRRARAVILPSRRARVYARFQGLSSFSVREMPFDALLINATQAIISPINSKFIITLEEEAAAATPRRIQQQARHEAPASKRASRGELSAYISTSGAKSMMPTPPPSLSYCFLAVAPARP